ncbi:MAG: hypothetical protein ACYT04_42890 [Nostoc sp.]
MRSFSLGVSAANQLLFVQSPISTRGYANDNAQYKCPIPHAQKLHPLVGGVFYFWELSTYEGHRTESLQLNKSHF